MPRHVICLDECVDHDLIPFLWVHSIRGSGIDYRPIQRGGRVEIEYYLEIYEPGSRDTTVGNYRTKMPFIPIAVGDIIDPQGLNGLPQSGQSFFSLRTTGIEHIIWEADGRIKQKVCVYTEEIPSGTSLVP